MADFSYRVDGMFALVLPESPDGERAMPELLAMTDGTAKVFVHQINALKADLAAKGYTMRLRRVKQELVTDEELLREFTKE